MYYLLMLKQTKLHVHVYIMRHYDLTNVASFSFCSKNNYHISLKSSIVANIFTQLEMVCASCYKQYSFNPKMVQGSKVTETFLK